MDGHTGPGPAADLARRDHDDILAGLTAQPKTLPSRLFYDEAGCALFGDITTLAEYYVTRAETALLAAHAAEIVDAAVPGTALVEYGASDEGKGAMLLAAADGRLSAYVPIDIAGPALLALHRRMRRSHPTLSVQTVQADFLAPVRLPALAAGAARLGFFPGSTIGNFEPDIAVRFLRQVRLDLARDAAGPARFVVGTDLRKDPAILLPAYDDARGVTAAFNRNILRHVNAITGAGFDPDAFEHRADWNADEGRIEMHLVSRRAQRIEVGGRAIDFAAGESIHTESSYKHTRDGFLALAAAAGWQPEGFWTDPEGRFGMHRLIAPG